jgi:hypothetical protein
MSEADDMLDGTDADPWEKMQLQEVLDELDAEQAAGIYDDGEPGGYDPEGPWRDQLAGISETMGRREASDADRVVADITDQLTRRPNTEQKIEMALRRISHGDYLQDAYYPQPARTPDGRFGTACGPLDELSRCSNRYHQAGCEAVNAQAAATGTPDAVRAWRDTVQGHAPPPGAAGAAQQMGLANGPEPGSGVDAWSGLLFGDPGPGPDVTARLRYEMGLDGQPPPEPPQSRVDVSYYRAALGI